jgi:hypothetical protein
VDRYRAGDSRARVRGVEALGDSPTYGWSNPSVATFFGLLSFCVDSVPNPGGGLSVRCTATIGPPTFPGFPVSAISVE